MVTALLLAIPVVLALVVQAGFKLLHRSAGPPAAVAHMEVVDSEVIADAA